MCASIWLDASASTAQRCASDKYNCLMLCIMHQYGSMPCIHGSLMCIRHLYGLMLCIRRHYGTVLLNAVHALIYGPMLCIRHHKTAQTGSSWFSMARCGASMTQAVHHAAIWLSAAWLITLNLLHHTLATFFFATLFAVNTWKKEEEQTCVLVVATLLPFIAGGRFWQSC